MGLASKHLLGISQLSPAEIVHILDTAETFRAISQREIKKVPTLRGRTVINLFFEASTRTRTSFELAGKRLSADTINISASTSSVTKGETLLDTARNLEAMSPDFIVVRHPSAGAPQALARICRAAVINAGDGAHEHPTAAPLDGLPRRRPPWAGAPQALARICRAAVINAGDGAHEHPTQALLDALTIRQHKGRVENLRVAIIGDILHSRVARSNMHLLTKLGAEVRLAGPGTLVPPELKDLAAAAAGSLRVASRLEEAIDGAAGVVVVR